MELLNGIELSDESYMRIRNVLDSTVFKNKKIVTDENVEAYLNKFNRHFGLDNPEPANIEFIEKDEMVM